MKQLNPYLIFQGNCKEALNFYQKCFNGKIELLQTFAQSPVDVPETVQHRIFNANFRAGELYFRASDSLPENDITVGNNFSLFVSFSDSEEQGRVLASLSAGGKVIMEMDNGFAMLVDKFGIQWMLARE